MKCIILILLFLLSGCVLIYVEGTNTSTFNINDNDTPNLSIPLVE